MKEGEKELDQAKLPSLLELKYQAVSDATEKLGSIASIRGLFTGFQQYLYGVNACLSLLRQSLVKACL